MPTYQYTCNACSADLEVVQRLTDDPLQVCPSCGGPLRKVFSPVGVVFKGSGFYRTDSRRSQNGKSNGKSGDSGGTESNGSGSTTTSESGSKDGAASKKDSSTSASKKDSSTSSSPSTGSTAKASAA